jgi:hypothetical protein
MDLNPLNIDAPLFMQIIVGFIVLLLVLIKLLSIIIPNKYKKD